MEAGQAVRSRDASLWARHSSTSAVLCCQVEYPWFFSAFGALLPPPFFLAAATCRVTCVQCPTTDRCGLDPLTPRWRPLAGRVRWRGQAFQTGVTTAYFLGIGSTHQDSCSRHRH